MAEAVVLPLVSKLQEVALSEGRALVGVGGEINRLRDKLMWLLAFLQDADPQRRAAGAGELMRVLVHQTRDAAFSAEDAVDHYAVRIDLSRYPGWSRAVIGFLAGITTQLRVRHRLSNDIAAIHARLEEIVGNKDKYRLDGSAPPSLLTWTASAASSSVSLHWGSSKPPIIGRDNQQQKLEEMLLSSTGRLAVIYVVGESGVGKTILVNSVCSKPSVREHFKVRIGVKVEKNAGISNILSLICKQLKKKNTESDDEKPSSRIQSHLGEELYLIVIDGRQMAIADWNALIHALPKNERGSRVVLITKKVPQFLDHPMHDVHDIELASLNQMDCRKLFHIRLHGKKEEGQNQTYPTRYYKRVHDITGGSPLAVILLAGLMHNKEYPHEWDRVFKYLESAKEKRLNRILSLSFDDLHHELKLCFLYLIAFPVSYKMYQGMLVNLWVSEGLVAPQHGKTVEQMGQLYLRQLTTRGLVTEASADGDYDFRHFVLHDSVYLFARSEAQEANFMELHDGDYFPSPDRVRRLTLQNSMDRYAALDNKMPKLRSIFAIFEEEIPASTAEDVSSPSCFAACCSCEQHRSPKIPRFDLTRLLRGSKFLRVIMVEGLNIGTELPEAIGGMVHLRYLGTRCRSLRRIHPSIGNLKNLQTIDVRNSLVHELPCSFWKITSLRHVFGSKLIVPRWTHELKQLNTLNSVRALKDWDGSMLTRMVNLKLLDVTIQEKLKEEKARKLSNNLKNLNNLTILNLEGVDLPISSIFTAPSLQRLKTIKLTGTLLLTSPSPEIDKMTTLPSDFQLPNLSELSLSKTCLQQGFIEKLGKLPLLSNLTLKDVSCDGEELVFRPDGFCCLQNLAVNNTSKRVVIEEHALPALVFFHIIGKSRNYLHSIHPTHKFIKKIRQEDINLFQRICTCHQKEITEG